MFYEPLMDFLYLYMVKPLFDYLYTNFGVNYYFGIVDGQVYFNETNNVVVVNESSYNLMDLRHLTTTILGLVIMALLVVVMVKFIVWLFKQISFITRF